MSYIRGIVVIIFATLLTTGCSTLADTKRSEGEGRRVSYSKSMDEIWPLTVYALNDLGLDVIEENKSQGYLLAKKGMSLLSYGENVAIFLKKVDNSTTTVEVISKKVLATTVFAKDWTDEIFMKLDARIKK
jgi:predicted RNA-binding protein (virulence factor B family)